jgi:Actin like proteins N terminal domain
MRHKTATDNRKQRSPVLKTASKSHGKRLLPILETSMNSATLRELPTTGSIRQPIPTGFDGGNGNTKLVLGDVEIRCPAYVLPIYSDLYDVPAPINGGLVEYVSGSRADLIGTRFLVGFPAYQQSPTGVLRVVDDKRGKILYGLQTLLGAIATQPHQDFWQLALVASIQDAKIFGDDLRESLKGGHTVRFNGSKQLSTVDINVLSVKEEGAGAIVQSRADINLMGQTLLYDFGAGTCILTLFGAKATIIDRTYSQGGVENLISAIARNLITRKVQASEGDRQLIRAGIEDQSFNYGHTGWNFREIYNAEIKPWVQSTLAPALKAAEPWTANTSARLAIGGGSQLPAINPLLTKRGILPVVDGGWSNARGLKTLAQHLGSR